jgi:hypothetical protein
MEMEPTREEFSQDTEFPQEMWKWRALFTPPEAFEREWRAWLGAAQKAEEQALLRYWAKLHA